MKILKTIGIGLLAIIILLCAISFFLPSGSHVERSMVINAPAETVFDQVNTLKKWDNWSPWQKMDPEMQRTYFGSGSGTGSGYSWKGPKTGEGKLTITDNKPNESVAIRLEFGGIGAMSTFHFEPVDSGVKVTWSLDNDKSLNPVFKYMNLMMQGMLEKQFDEGLNDIKKTVERIPQPQKKIEMKIEATTISDQNYLAVRDTASMSNISQKLGGDYGTIGEAMKKQGLKMTGAPFAIYYSDSSDNMVMDACVSVDKAGKEGGRVKPGIIKAGNAVVGHYFGNYQKLNEGHYAIKEWISRNNKKIIGAPWEIYMTDPGMEKDTAKWQTDIFYPVE
ncbi:MAG: SRPBCC family protein [Bacteroidia bacterium]